MGAVTGTVGAAGVCQINVNYQGNLIISATGNLSLKKGALSGSFTTGSGDLMTLSLTTIP